jgi:DNA modification methylase
MKTSWRVECCDCLDFLRTLPDGSVDMIWTDPPYGHGNMDGDLQAARVRDDVKGARKRAAQPIANDKGPNFDALMVAFLDEAARVLRADCCCCCCCMAGGGPNVTFARVASEIDKRHAFFQAIVWDKSARGNGMGWRYRRNYEFVMVSHRKGGTLLWNDGHPAIPNIMRDMPVRNRLHPNEKPVSLIKRFIEAHTTEGMTILDPFCGSGATGAACIQTGRNFIGCEIDPGYADIARRRCREAEESVALLTGGAA